MAELEDLGTPPVFAEIVRVGYAVARLRLPTDNTVPREVAATAAKVDQATMALQGAVDLAAELQDEGVRQPVSLIPPPSTEFGQERAHVWARHAELQATVEEFVGTSLNFPPPMGRAIDYEAVMTQAVRALGAMEEQRRLALGSGGPRRPDPPDPQPLHSSRAPITEPGVEERPRAHDRAAPRLDGDRPPAAVRPASARPEGTHRDPGARQAPTFEELHHRISTVTVDRMESERGLGLARPPADRVADEGREL
ncbi:MAG: hypothetical protein ACLQT7_07645 [Candidatus Dormibacteria bacterium]